MAQDPPTVLRFVLRSTGNPIEIMKRFHPQGSNVLNRTEWRQKEPRSCGITSVRLRPYRAGSDEPMVFDIEVECRPKGWISFVGNTKYDGWTAMVLDRKSDGTLLDGHGNPLPEGETPVYLPFEVFHDAEFNELDFGEFVGETELKTIKHRTYEEVVREIRDFGNFSISIQSTFIAPRRHRPTVKMVLSTAPSGTRTDGFGTRIININSFTPHLQQVLLDQLIEVVSGFVEGRYSIKNISNDEQVLVELHDLLVDCTGNEEGRESHFDCLAEQLPPAFLEELARRLMAAFQVEVTIVDGAEYGLLMRRSEATASKMEGMLDSLAARTGVLRQSLGVEQATAPKDADALTTTVHRTLEQLNAMWSEIQTSEHRLQFPPAVIDVLRQAREQFVSMIERIPTQRQVGGGIQACWNLAETVLRKLQESLIQRR